MIPSRCIKWPGCGKASNYEEDFVKWIPTAALLLAVTLAIGVYFMFGMIA